ncbi:UNVERIFIED_CONTAM: hypothetical protein NCL1_60127 [Trichonephila clavipes]
MSSRNSQEVNVRGLMLYYDNASSHTAGLKVEFLKQKQIKVIVHPLYSPDEAMYATTFGNVILQKRING